jgi:hypothetical protein
MTVGINESRVNILSGKFLFGCHGVEGIGRSDIPRVKNDAIFDHHGGGCAKGGVGLINFFGNVCDSIRLNLSI